MSATQVVLLVVLVVVVVAVAAFFVQRSRRQKESRRRQLRERFGPEYERAVQDSGDRRQAERHLADVAERHDRLELRPLSAQSLAAYADRWSGVQQAFVDDPYGAVDTADALVQDAMRERGYPVDDFEQRADIVSVDHPDVVQHYRSAHAVHHGDLRSVSTEDLREALVHYRALFTELIGAGPADGPDREAEHREH